LSESIGVGDFACLGNPDLAVANFNGSGDNIAVLKGDGSGGFTSAPGSLFPANGNPRPLAVGEFNGDGTPDIAVVNSFMGRVTVLYDTASGCPQQLESRGYPPLIAPVYEPTDSILSPSRPQIERLSCTLRTIDGRRELTLRLSLANSATVVARLERVVRRRVRGRWRKRLAEIASFTIQGKAGANVLAIMSSRHLHLVPGRYELLVRASRAGQGSQVRAVTRTIHR
jgi:FG-GAP-like repeat